LVLTLTEARIDYVPVPTLLIECSELHVNGELEDSIPMGAKGKKVKVIV